MDTENNSSGRESGRIKACRLRGGDACPCHWTECRIYAATFKDVLRKYDEDDAAALAEEEAAMQTCCT